MDQERPEVLNNIDNSRGATFLFSVVVPVYNKEPHLRRAIDSVLNQSYKGFELICVDDSSSDGSRRVLESYQDPRVRVFSRGTPGPGGYAARNLGTKCATAPWIVFLDADDEWSAVHLQRYADAIGDHPSIDVWSCGWMTETDGEKRKNYRCDRYHEWNSLRGRHVLSLQEYLQAESQNQRPICTSVACVRKKLLLDVGGFPDAKMARGGDLDTWLRCVAAAGNMGWSPHVGAIYHRNAINMVTKTTKRTASAIQAQRKTVETITQDIDSDSSELLKRTYNQRIVNAWKDSAASGSPDFRLIDHLYLGNTGFKVKVLAVVSCLPRPILKILILCTKIIRRIRAAVPK